MAVPKFAVENVTAAGTDAASATQIVRTAKSMAVIVSGGGSGGPAGVILPNNPVLGDVVELYSNFSSGYILYVGSIPVQNIQPGVTPIGEIRGSAYCRFCGNAGWFIIVGAA